MVKSMTGRTHFQVFKFSGFRVFGFSGFRDFGISGFRVFGFSGFGFWGFRVVGFSASDSGQGPCKVHDFGFTVSESGHVVLALVVSLDTPWLPLVCPWGTKAHRHGQPRAAKGCGVPHARGAIFFVVLY